MNRGLEDLLRDEREVKRERTFKGFIYVAVAVVAILALHLCVSPATPTNVGLVGLLLAPIMLVLSGIGLCLAVNLDPRHPYHRARQGGAVFVFVIFFLAFFVGEMGKAVDILRGREDPDESFVYSWFIRARLPYHKQTGERGWQYTKPDGTDGGVWGVLDGFEGRQVVRVKTKYGTTAGSPPYPVKIPFNSLSVTNQSFVNEIRQRRGLPKLGVEVKGSDK